MNHISNEQLQRYLNGIKYPASTGEIFDTLRDKGAEQDILGVIEQLPNRQFMNQDEFTGFKWGAGVQ